MHKLLPDDLIFYYMEKGSFIQNLQCDVLDGCPYDNTHILETPTTKEEIHIKARTVKSALLKIMFDTE